MAGVGNKRPKAAAVKQASIEGTSAFLESLPEKPKEDLSLREAIDQMRDSVRSALSKGYSYQELAAMLTEKGIKISAFTLKNYVPSGRRRSSKEQVAEKTTTRKPRKAKEESSDDSSADASANEAQLELASVNNESNGTAPKAEEEKAPAKSTRGQGAAAKTKTASESTVKQTPAKRTRSTAAKAKDTKTTAAKSRRKS